jgi:Fic family protein
MLKVVDFTSKVSYNINMDKIITISPSFNSRLTRTVFDLERLRYSEVEGSTPPWLFFDLKDIIHILESLTSARIEGNRTTLVSAVNDVIEGSRETRNESLKELRNIREGITFIEENVNLTDPITLGMIREFHKLTVKGLRDDGSKSPGQFRAEEVTIGQSSHIPPNHVEVPALMQELIDYINEDQGRQYDIIKIAIAHHRFTSIHPFDNGNGRTARLLTYAMLVKARFIDDGIRLLNPSSIFCMDRHEYYRLLELADKGGEKNIETWCTYVANGILDEVSRVSKLLDKDFTVSTILTPVIKKAYSDKNINDREFEILKIAMEKDIIQAKDVRHLFGTTASAAVQTSRVLTSMKTRRLLMSLPKSPNKYVIRFSNNYLLGGVLEQMDINNLIPATPSVIE